jgi:hypothetical protein
MRMTDGSMTVNVTWDTEENYGVLADLVEERHLSPFEVLDLFINEFGLQLLSEERTASMLEELGFEEV